MQSKDVQTVLGLIILVSLIGCSESASPDSSARANVSVVGEPEPEQASLGDESQVAGPAGIHPDSETAQHGDKAQPQKPTQRKGNAVESDAVNPPLQPFTPWCSPHDRAEIRDGLNAHWTDQSGNTGALHDLMGGVSVVTFFYTRCSNARKCSTTVGNCAKLQDALQKRSETKSVNILMITFEPQHDTPDRLRRYGAARNVRFNDQVRMLRLDSPGHQTLLEELEAPVSFNAGWVNVHGIVLYLLDERSCVARRYHTMMWDVEQVVADVERLLSELTATDIQLKR